MLRLPEIELVAVSDPDPEQRAVAERLLSESGAGDSVRVHASHADVFKADDIHAVSICAANAAHHDLTLAAAEAGKHVLCEKPLAVSLAEATAMVRGCAEHGVTLATAYPVRHAAPVWEAKRRLASGELGAIRAMSLTNVLRAQTTGWFIDPARSGGGAIRDHIVHATDLMRWFSGAEVAVRSTARPTPWRATSRSRTPAPSSRSSTPASSEPAIPVGTARAPGASGAT